MESIKDWTSLTKWSLETYWPKKAPSEQVLPALNILFDHLKMILDNFTALKDLRPWCESILTTLSSLDATSVSLPIILERWPSTAMSAIPFLDSTKLVQLETLLSACIMFAQNSLNLNQQMAATLGSLPSTSTESQMPSRPEAIFTFSTFAPLEKTTRTVDADQSQSASALLGLLGSDSDTSESETNGVADNCCYIYQKASREYYSAK